MAQSTEVQDFEETVEKILRVIIDEWYEKVSSFYVTAEQIAETGVSDRQEELKRFHDETGHRIKFSKDELDFTYGLRSYVDGDGFRIEVSVNNKVENFDIDEFRERLSDHYLNAGHQIVPTPVELKSRSCTYGEIFDLGAKFGEALRLEVREGRADIMRLSFRLNPKLIVKLLSHPLASKQLVENFCVTPFRSIFASVYRRGN
jgi:hypothetical protein